MRTRHVISIGAMLVGIGCGLAMAKRRRRTRFAFQNKAVVITGGARGLGLVLARRLAREGAKLAILARDSEELHRAEMQLIPHGVEVFGVQCDLLQQEEVNAAIGRVVARFGGVDVLINNAGMIQVGPLDHMTVQDFEDAIGIHLYAPLYCTLAVLPHMRNAGGGRVVNIASIGGKIAVPHMLPYCASKFALVGLSDGLRAELHRDNILVTTVCPGLMRTGSPRNALFKGRHRREYAWFAISGSLPIFSIDAERAARKIIEGCRRGAAHVVIGLHARAAIILHDLFPNVAASVASLANRVLPSPEASGSKTARSGSESQSWLAPRWLTRLSESAALRNNEI